MLILDTTLRRLEFKLSAPVTTNELPFMSGYVEVGQSTFALTAVSANDGASNGATAVTLVAAPGASLSRQLKYLSIRNKDTVPAVVILQIDDNGTKREISSWTLAVDDTLLYEDGHGFYVLTATGALK